MIVQCYRALEGEEKRFSQPNDVFTIGHKYFVLEVEVAFGGEILYRLVGENLEGMPALFHSAQFKVVDSRIPSCWGVYDVSPRSMTLSPKAWQEYDSGDPDYGFWEHCYDAEPDARVLYRKVVKEMHAELVWEGEHQISVVASRDSSNLLWA